MNIVYVYVAHSTEYDQLIGAYFKLYRVGSNYSCIS